MCPTHTNVNTSEGRLPGVLYGPGRDGDKERYLVTVERREIEKQMRRLGDSIASTVFDLKVGDSYTQRVLIRDLDRDPGMYAGVEVCTCVYQGRLVGIYYPKDYGGLLT